MPQRTRNIIANILLGVGVLFIAAFIVTHFMAPRPSWHSDVVWLGLASVILSGLVRGRPRRGAMQPPD